VVRAAQKQPEFSSTQTFKIPSEARFGSAVFNGATASNGISTEDFINNFDADFNDDAYFDQLATQQAQSILVGPRELSLSERIFTGENISRAFDDIAFRRTSVPSLDSMNQFGRPSTLDNRIAQAARNVDFIAGGTTATSNQQVGFLESTFGKVSSVSTGLTSGLLLSNLPLGGLEISSQKLFFNTVDSITGFTDSAGRLVTTAKVGQLGALPLFTEFNQPSFSFLAQGDNVGKGNLGFAFNDVGVNGKFNGFALSNALDVLGRQAFYVQSVVQVVDLGLDIKNDVIGSNVGFIDSLSTNTLDKAGQTFLDIAVGRVALTGLPGAALGLTYAFRGELFEASRVSFENQVKEQQFNLDNNILIPRMGPK
jgi:hypothetical protein